MSRRCRECGAPTDGRVSPWHVHAASNPAYRGDEVLFGDPPPQETETISRATVL